MDHQLYEQVLCAVDICHSGTSTQHERNAAYSFCEEFQRRPDCVQYAFYLLQGATKPYHHRHFALHLIETWIRQNWKTCSPEDTVRYRTNLLTIVASHLNAEEPTYLKEKLVKVVADIAKRSFPQRWPDMLDHLMQLWSIGPLQTEIVMLIFRSIAEDCVSSTFNSTIPPTRRKDLLQGLNASFPILFPFIYRELEQQYTRLQQHDTRAATVILACLQMMKEFLDWMPVTTPASPDANFIAVACLLLQSPSGNSPHAIQIAAAECLEEYFSRSFVKESISLLHDTSATCWSHLTNMSITDPDGDAEQLLLHQHINRILVTWGTHNLSLLDQPSHMPILQQYLALLQTLFSHPSLLITEAQVIVWLNILKCKALLPHINYPALWTTCLNKYFKLSSPDRDDAIPTVLLEFDDHDAYISFYGNFRGRLYGVLRLLVQQQPSIALGHLYDRLHYVLTQQGIGRDHLDDLGHCTDITTAQLYHEGMVSIIECLVKTLPDSVYENSELLAQLGRSVDLLVGFKTTDPWLLFRHCLALASFSKYYTRTPSMYPIVFERLFSLIVFAEPGESIHGTMRPTSTNVRRRALASLISICHAGPQHVLPFLPILCNQVIGLFPQVLDSESVLMYEMLVVVSNSMSTQQERHAFIQQIAAAPLAQWTSPEITQVVASEEVLVQSLEQSNESLIYGMLKVLTTLYGIAKRIQVNEMDDPNGHPFTTIWPLLLPNLTTLIRTLHTLSSPPTRQALIQSTTIARGVLYMSHEEINQALLGKEQIEITNAPLLKAARWAKNIRDISYHLLGCACSHPVMYTMDVVGMFQQTVLVHLDSLEHRHWKSFISSVWLPFVKGCPSTLYTTVLQPTISHLLCHLNERISKGYTCTEKNGYEPCFDGVDIQPTSIDTISHAVFLEVVRHSVDFVEGLIDSKTVIDMNSDHPKHVIVESDQILRDYLLSCEGITQYLVHLLVGVLGWTDTLSCRRASTLLDKLVTVLYQVNEYHLLFGKNVFTAGLWTLLHHFHDVDDGLKWELINLLRNIYCRLTLGILPVDECKGIDPLHQPTKPESELSYAPRAILGSLHGITPAHVMELEIQLRQNHSTKIQKNLIKEFVEIPFLAYVQAPHTFKAIDDLPETLVIHQPTRREPNNSVVHDTTSLFGGI